LPLAFNGAGADPNPRACGLALPGGSRGKIGCQLAAQRYGGVRTGAQSRQWSGTNAGRPDGGSVKWQGRPGAGTRGGDIGRGICGQWLSTTTSTTVGCARQQQHVAVASNVVNDKRQCNGGRSATGAYTGTTALEPSPVGSVAVRAPVEWHSGQRVVPGVPQLHCLARWHLWGLQAQGTVEVQQQGDSGSCSAPTGPPEQASGAVLEPEQAQGTVEAVTEALGNAGLALLPPPLDPLGSLVTPARDSRDLAIHAKVTCASAVSAPPLVVSAVRRSFWHSLVGAGTRVRLGNPRRGTGTCA